MSHPHPLSSTSLTDHAHDRISISVTGDIDAANAARVFGEIRDLLAAHPAGEVVLDLAAVDFCDVAAVRALVVLSTTTPSPITVARTTPQVSWLMHTLGVADLLRLDS